MQHILHKSKKTTPLSFRLIATAAASVDHREIFEHTAPPPPPTRPLVLAADLPHRASAEYGGLQPRKSAASYMQQTQPSIMFFSHCNSIMMVYVHTQCMRQQRGGAHRLLQQPLPPPDCLQPFALREPMFLQQLVHALVGLLLPVPDCAQRAGICTHSLHSDLHLCTRGSSTSTPRVGSQLINVASKTSSPTLDRGAAATVFKVKSIACAGTQLSKAC